MKPLRMLPLRFITKERVQQLPPGTYDVKAACASRADADPWQVQVRVEIQIFESSRPQGWHHAYPTNGKVLWKGEIAGLMPDSTR